MRDFAAAFYNSQAWRSTRVNYMKSKAYLCERCLKEGVYRPAVIVHHKTWLTSENITDSNITLNWDNLEALCREHHEEEHAEGNKAAKHRKYERRYTVDKDGNVTSVGE